VVASEVRNDVRRLDVRIFQILLIQLAMLGTALGSLVTALPTAPR
jgi:hypothetical protein